MAKIRLSLPKGVIKALKEQQDEEEKAKTKEAKKLSRIELLKLCLLYVRCRDCKRVMPRQKMRGCSINHCAICRASKIDFRDEFLEWYETVGKSLDKILPNPMPKLEEVERLVRQAVKEK